MSSMMDRIPSVPLAKWTDQAIDYLQAEWGESTQAFATGMEELIKGLQGFLINMPPELLIIIFGLLAWWLVNKKTALFTIIGLMFIYNIGLWKVSMDTLALVIGAVALCMIIGIPLGILAAKNTTAHRIISPVLDFMQTLPAFVYLLPAIPFFGLGVVPAILTTIVFAMPPVIRLTDGKIIGIDSGAGIMIASEEAIKNYNLDYELAEGSEGTMIALLKQAIDNNKWVVVTGWTPHWKFARWDLKYLDDPNKDYGEAETINTIVRQGLKEDMPEVYTLFDNFAWSPEDLGSAMGLAEDLGNAEDGAREWIKQNPELVNSWLPDQYKDK